MKKTIRRVSLPLLLISLTGCVTPPSSDPERGSVAFAARLMAEKSALAAQAQADYSALVAEDHLVRERKQASIESDEVDIDFIGSPNEFLQTFAHRYAFRYVESGARRQLININVRVTKTSPVEVLRTVGNQITGGADVVLDRELRVIRLIYKPNTPSRG